MTLPRPLRASGNGWRWLGVYPLPTGGKAHGWSHDELWLRCLSAVEMVEQNPPGSGLVVPHFHVSVTFSCALTGVRRAATDQEMELVRAAFGLAGAEEDNHGPGIARHLWIACGREKEPACPCKQDEQRIVEGDRVRHEPETSPAAAAPQGGPAGGLVSQQDQIGTAAGHTPQGGIA